MKVPRLRVAARSSSFTFKGKAADVREVGQKLHVTSALEGTVRRAREVTRYGRIGEYQRRSDAVVRLRVTSPEALASVYSSLLESRG